MQACKSARVLGSIALATSARRGSGCWLPDPWFFSYSLVSTIIMAAIQLLYVRGCK